MVSYGKIVSSIQPPELEITDKNVFIAQNIELYTQELDDKVIQGYKYDYFSYTKDEYILLLAEKSKKIDSLEEELTATKILLGVD